MSYVFEDHNYQAWQSENRKLAGESDKENALPVLDEFGFLVQLKQFESACIPPLKDLMVKQFPELLKADEILDRVIREMTGTNIFEYFKYIYGILLWNEAGKHPNDECPEFYEFGKRQELYTTHEPVLPHHFSDWISSYPRDEWERLCKEENKERAQKDAYFLSIYHGYINVVQDALIKLLPQILNINQDWWYVYKFITIREAWRWKERLEQIRFLVVNGLSAEWMEHHKKAESTL